MGAMLQFRDAPQIVDCKRDPRGGCSASRARARADEGEAKQWPKAPPPSKNVPPPADLSIQIKVDGSDKGMITAATLTGAKPDFEDAERTAWLIPTLVPDAGRPARSSKRCPLPGQREVRAASSTASSRCCS